MQNLFRRHTKGTYPKVAETLSGTESQKENTCRGANNTVKVTITVFAIIIATKVALFQTCVQVSLTTFIAVTPHSTTMDVDQNKSVSFNYQFSIDTFTVLPVPSKVAETWSGTESQKDSTCRGANNYNTVKVTITLFAIRFETNVALFQTCLQLSLTTFIAVSPHSTTMYVDLNKSVSFTYQFSIDTFTLLPVPLHVLLLFKSRPVQL